MGANVGSNSIVNEGLALYLDAANSYSRHTLNKNPDTWTAASAAGDGGQFFAITYGNGKFVAVGQDGDNRIMYSSDAVTWSSFDSSSMGDIAWRGVAYGNGKFVITSLADGSGGKIAYASDSDLTSWTEVTPPEDNNWSNITYGNGKFVAVATSGTNRVMYASDSNLNSWTAVAGAQASTSWYDIAYGNGKFVAVSSNGAKRVQYALDNDLSTWYTATAAEYTLWRGITYGNGKFVAVADLGTNRIMYSIDGINWTGAAAPEANAWYRIAYGNGMFVSVSYNGTNRIMYALDNDLDNWKSATPATNSWYGFAHGGDRFVAVSYNGPSARSVVKDYEWDDISQNIIEGRISSANSTTFGGSGASSYIELNTGSAVGQYYTMLSDAGKTDVTLGTNPFAIEFWVNRYDGYYILDQRFEDVDSASYITFSASQSNRLAYRPYDGSVIFDTDTDQPSATNTSWTGWRHYVISREGTGSNECKLYYNGALVAQGTDSGNHDYPIEFKIGLKFDGSSPFKGRLGLFKIYKGKALTAAEVLQNYNATKMRYD